MSDINDPIRPDCESCGGDAVTNRYDEHNGWQPICASCAYAARCEDAARRQGLTEPREALTDAGLTVELLQTGGFCMVLSVDPRPDRAVWITLADEIDTFLICRYPLAADGDMATDEPDAMHVAPLADLVATVRGML